MSRFKLLFAFLFVTSALFGEQKIVLISGASSGIGLATAKAFQKKGWKVCAGVRQNIPEELKMENISTFQLDVTNDLQIQTAIDTILKSDGKIDVLINNAGIGIIGAEECVTIEEAQQLFDVNFFGVLRLTQAVLPSMRQQRSGHIINISSAVGIHSLPGLGLYSASKFALEGMSESLAATVSPWNIHVSIVEPGGVKNDWGKHALIGSRNCNEEFYNKLNTGICKMVTSSYGQPCEEIANLLVEIAENPTPLFRYQTSPEIKKWVSEKLVDITGTTSHQANLEFIKRRTE